jgi:hypothetical protein
VSVFNPLAFDTAAGGVLAKHACMHALHWHLPHARRWRKPMPGGKTAVLAINGAALPHSITIDVATVLALDREAAGLEPLRSVRPSVRSVRPSVCAWLT